MSAPTLMPMAAAPERPPPRARMPDFFRMAAMSGLALSPLPAAGDDTEAMAAVVAMHRGSGGGRGRPWLCFVGLCASIG